MSKKPSEILGDNASYEKPAHDELAAALGGTNSAESFYFPENIQEIDHWMAIRIIKRSSSSLRREQDYLLNADLARIFLPLPLNLATAYNQTYNAEGIGPIGNALAGAKLRSTINSLGNNADKLVDAVFNLDLSKGLDAAGGAASTIGKKLKEVWDKTDPASAAKTAGAYGVYTLAGAAGATPYGQGALGGAGLARNPYMALLYSQPEFRVHEFSWKVVAKNFEESVAILNIIKLLKYYSAPSQAAGAGSFLQFFYDYPEQFEIDFHHHEFLFNIGPSVLKNVSVNYHAEGQPLYFTKEVVVDELGEEEQQASETVKVPVSIQIGLSFQEVTTLTKESIDNYKR
jgi:hypothetical protein